MSPRGGVSSLSGLKQSFSGVERKCCFGNALVVPWQRKGENMNLELGFPEFSEALPSRPQQSLAPLVERFQKACQEPDSPIRAIHHQPASAGEHVEMPPDVRPELRAA